MEVCILAKSQRTILMLGAGIEQVYAIKLAKKKGLYVIAVDKNPGAPGFNFADESYPISTRDIDGLRKFIGKYKKRKISGVMTMASDIPLSVAILAKEIGSPSISLEVAELASDKLKMKRHLKKKGVPLPWFCEIDSLSQLEKSVKERGYPLVLKPVDNSGARGVIKLTPKVDLAWAYHFSRSYSRCGKLILEEFLEGPQISTEGVMWQGRFYITGFSDRNYSKLEEFSPFMVEDGGSIPSSLSKKETEEVNTVFEEAVRALGIDIGPAKGDMVLTKDGAKVIEIAARLSGGNFCDVKVPLSTGVDIVDVVMDISIGDPPDLKKFIPTKNLGVAERFFFPPAGKIKRIKGLERLADIDWVKKFTLYYRPGDTLPPLTDHTGRAGSVVTVGENVKQAIERAETVVRDIVRFEVEKL
ncbi:ATP-grasp domain-containing protein [Candidatus Aerophobetes bacterium]|nr:ATP-grasp domain-containing protein [Candidatus Aerophobetes bacterium]